jgi:hypothetical protein
VIAEEAAAKTTDPTQWSRLRRLWKGWAFALRTSVGVMFASKARGGQGPAAATAWNRRRGWLTVRRQNPAGTDARLNKIVELMP